LAQSQGGQYTTSGPGVKRVVGFGVKTRVGRTTVVWLKWKIPFTPVLGAFPDRVNRTAVRVSLKCFLTQRRKGAEAQRFFEPGRNGF
jgi:hypothetical protein